VAKGLARRVGRTHPVAPEKAAHFAIFRAATIPSLSGTNESAGARTFYIQKECGSSLPVEEEENALNKGKSSSRSPCRPSCRDKDLVIE
jgi:hypothetical protein